MQGETVGRVVEIWRYRVRSPSGEFLSQTDVEAAAWWATAPIASSIPRAP